MLVSIVLFAAALLPQTPDPTLPPAGVTAALTAKGRGVQIYVCTVQDNKLQWVFQAPEAALIDSSGQQVGTHAAGPTWTWNDGSSIEGKVLQKQPSPNAQAIPWLLLETHPTGTSAGILSGVVYVRRSDTQAGSAPAEGCDPQHAGILLRVPYEAIYTFYKKAP